MGKTLVYPRIGLTLVPVSLPPADTRLVQHQHLRERQLRQPSESAGGAKGDGPRLREQGTEGRGLVVSRPQGSRASLSEQQTN